MPKFKKNKPATEAETEAAEVQDFLDRIALSETVQFTVTNKRLGSGMLLSRSRPHFTKTEYG